MGDGGMVLSADQRRVGDSDAFWRKLVLPQEERMRLGIPWHGGYRWFRSPNAGKTMTKRPYHPNLRKKPHAPSKGRGPVQRAIRRAFMASGAEVLNSTEIYDWTHGRRRFGRRKSMPFGVYSRTL